MKVSVLDRSAAMGDQRLHDLGQRDAGSVFRRRQAAPEIAHRLEVHGPDGGRLSNREIHDGADLVHIHARNQGGRQHDADPGLPAIADGLRLQPHELGAAKPLVDIVADTVELQENAVEPGFGERGEIVRLARDAHAVGVQLHELEPAGTDQRNDFGQVVAHRWLAARKLDVNAPARRRRKRIEPAADFGLARIRPLPAGGSVADRAGEIAAGRYLKQHAAALLPVIRAQAAIVGAAALRLPSHRPAAGKRRAGRSPSASMNSSPRQTGVEVVPCSGQVFFR